jgi:hypothetical protein
MRQAILLASTPTSSDSARKVRAKIADGCAPPMTLLPMRTVGTERTPSICALNSLATTSASPSAPLRPNFDQAET